MIQTETTTDTVIDPAVLKEVVHWIKTLKEAGVSADTAAVVTSKVLIAVSTTADEEDEYYDE